MESSYQQTDESAVYYQDEILPRLGNTSAGSPTLSRTREAIRATLAVVLDGESVAELRVLGSKNGIISGYYDDYDALARDAATLDGQGDGVYVTLNPVQPDLLARAKNRVKKYAQHTTGDNDIRRLRWLFIDLDPVRPSGISSTEDEHTAALTLAQQIGDALRQQGWPAPVLADSGNGAHLLYRIDCV